MDQNIRFCLQDDIGKFIDSYSMLAIEE